MRTRGGPFCVAAWATGVVLCCIFSWAKAEPPRPTTMVVTTPMTSSSAGPMTMPTTAPLKRKMLQSGLQAGESVGPFEVYDVTGPSGGRSVCYRCRYGNRPVVAVFARTLSPALAEIAKRLDEQVEQQERARLGAVVVILADKNAKLDMAKEVTAFAELHRLHLPLTVYEGVNGPMEQHLAAEADLTLVFWRGGDVQANCAVAEGDWSAAHRERMLSDIRKLCEAEKQGAR